MATGWRSLGIGLAGLAGFLLVAYVVLKQAPDWFAETDTVEARQGVRTASLALLAGTIGVIGAVYTARTFALNRAGQITDRFTKAIEQLGHEQLDVRLGGIYALERIAKDSREDHPQVVEVLTAYVREHAPRPDVASEPDSAPDSAATDVPPDASDSAATDVLAVLAVLGRRTVAHETDMPRRLDLASTNLRCARLEQAELRQADFSKADLSGAVLSEAKLSESDLMWAVLYGASPLGADLTHAVLAHADLRGANLAEANLGGADLDSADLTGAALVGANLTGATLNYAGLVDANLTGAVLDDATLTGARYAGGTVWPEGFDPEAAGAVRADNTRGENPEPRA